MTLKERLLDMAVKVALAIGFLACIILIPLGALGARNNLSVIFECLSIGSMILIPSVSGHRIYVKFDSVKKVTAAVMAANRRHTPGEMNCRKKKIAGEIRKWTNIFFVLCVVPTAIFVVDIMVHFTAKFADREHAVRIWFPIDPYESPTYEILFVALATSLIYCYISSTTVAYLMFTIGFMIIGQFRMLRDDLTHVREDAVERVRRRRELKNNTEMSEETPRGRRDWKSLMVLVMERKAKENERAEVGEVEVDDEMRLILGECVDRYQECVRLVRHAVFIFQPIFDVGLFVSAVSLLAFILLITSFDLTTSDKTIGGVDREKNLAELLNYIAGGLGLLTAVSIVIGVGCWTMNIITDESDQVRDAVYNCDWFSSSESFKKSMRIIMCRANQPLHVSALRFLPLTMETFLGIMHRTYSYYMALSTIFHRKDWRQAFQQSHT